MLTTNDYSLTTSYGGIMGLIVGLTGGIVSGKSTVAKMFKDLGAKIVDIDKLGHKVILPSKPAWEKIIKLFGKDLLKEDLKIDRKKLGKIVFNDQKLLKKLNEITHPEIIKLIKKEINLVKNKTCKNGTEEILIIDGALIYEAKIDNLMEKIIVVYIKEDEQIRRLQKRDNLSIEEALKRVKSQMSIDGKIKFADYIIYNSNSLDKTRKQVENIWKNLISHRDSRSQ